MEDKKIDISSELALQFDVNPADGDIGIELKHSGKLATSGFYSKVKLEHFIEALKKAIPGQVDDAILDGLKKMLSK